MDQMITMMQQEMMRECSNKSYEEYLVMAVMCEPTLAQTLLEMPSVTSARPHSEVLSVNIIAFLEDVVKSPLLEDIIQPIRETLWEELLIKHKLSVELLDTAIRYCRLSVSSLNRLN